MYNFVVSESAAKRINRLNSKESNSQMLRVKVEGGGCNGLKYQIGLTDLKNSDDVIFTKDGANVVVDKISINYLAQAHIFLYIYLGHQICDLV